MLPLDVNKKNSLIAAGLTLVFCLLLLGCCFWMGLYRQNPPPPEEGVEVNVGDSDFGSGNSMEAVSQAAPPSKPQVNSASNAVTEDISSQSTEESISLDKEKKETPNTPQEEVEKPKEPEINKNALFPGNKKKSEKGGSEGITQGSGNQGQFGGDPNSKRYDGTPGAGGMGYSLSGRSASALPKPTYNSNKQGKVVVRIWVDREGNVVKAEPGYKGTTATDGGLRRRAKEAALKAKFTPSKDAPELQVGTITYDFRTFN
jgi:TonB family protein